jgi:tRNA(His) 5'-end guanylyltransferase
MKDALGDRMKDFYEDRTRIKLGRRTNTLIRIDGKAFHTYTKGLNKPYDTGLLEDMNETTKFLCENIQGAKMGYVQSDEISIWLTDYDDLATSAWFDNNLQKMCSVAASLATAKFNQLRTKRAYENIEADPIAHGQTAYDMGISQALNNPLAMFDARVFQISYIDEVVNYFIWRQQDATRNSISMAAQSMFSHKELQGKKASEMQDIMMLQKSVNWNDYPTRFKRGAAIVKAEDTYRRKKGETGPGLLIDPADVVNAKQAIATLGEQSAYEIYSRTHWVIDNEIPIFTQDRDYIKNQLQK